MRFPVNTDVYTSLRQQMVETQLRLRGIADERVLQAMLRVPRHEFAPERFRDQAYEDHPLPIGEEQTISQPYIVALMLEALTLSPGDKVLEVGTGSGYVTALLAELVSEVISIERHSLLAEHASQLLAKLGYSNAKVIVGDGSRGLVELAPYDAVIVSAASPRLPPELIEQLAEKGRMIIPIGEGESQQLQFIYKEDGRVITRMRELCRFVPLVSDSIN
ncbi:MAG TPA: protein-L-isoaspartate(D-aspartate) O-methyltransferase [Candidatus Eisenbacteria bacterium]|nr:protein-L-isoaspartate(D-aspartate) O-methyltransferase [Candidatus Eisenbacteria bacterium]